ncbi:MAG: hypothetical protein D5R98_05500 [Desulfonatronovibrio sp. MSAO_Bac4]|nr:MAG: hypothetical protein D5R98_05500 [Desulfonatronovibrio sp. MSAO_Bac4]
MVNQPSIFFKKTEAGGALLGAVMAIMVMGVLGGSLVSMIGSSSMHEVRANHGEQAYYLAESGFRYAVSQYRQNGIEALLDLDGESMTVPGGGQFDLGLEQVNAENGYTMTFSAVVEIVGDELSLMITAPVDPIFPERGGVFIYLGEEYRYLEYIEAEGRLEKVVPLDKEGSFPEEANGQEIALQLSPDMVVIKSTATYPETGLFNVERTVTYAWPLSGESGSPLEEIEDSEYAVAPLQEDHWATGEKSRVQTDTYQDPVLGTITTTDIIAYDYFERQTGAQDLSRYKYLFIPFKHLTAGVDFATARNNNAGCLSYEVQVKIAISGPGIYGGDTGLEHASAGIAFRTQRTDAGDKPDYSGYVVSFMRYKWPVSAQSRDFIPNSVKAGSPQRNDELLLILWEQSGGSGNNEGDRQWLAYAVLDGIDEYVESTGDTSDGYFLQHLASMVIRVVEIDGPGGRMNNIQVFFGDANLDIGREANENPYDINEWRLGYRPASGQNNYNFPVKWPSLPGMLNWHMDNDRFSAVGGDPVQETGGAVQWSGLNNSSDAVLLVDDRGEYTVVQDSTYTTQAASFSDENVRPEVAMHAFGNLNDGPDGPERRRVYFMDFAIRLLKGDGSSSRSFINPIQQ